MTTAVLGVDVGNSKTHAAAITLAGDVVGLVTGPGASPDEHGVAGSWAIIDALAAQALGGAPVAAAAYAVAGLDFPEDEREFARHGPPGATVVNDALAVLRAGSAGGDGVAVVAGAGMNCVGRRGDAVVRFPALGAVSGDWGGGIGLGLEALGAACRAEDGRAAPSSFTAAVPAVFGYAEAIALARDVHRGAVTRVDLARLAPLVLRHADAGEPVCVALAQRQADEIVALARAAAARLGAPFAPGAPASLPVVVAGGLVGAGCRTFDERLAASGLDVTRLSGPPVTGAVLLAADAAGVSPDVTTLAAALRARLAAH